MEVITLGLHVEVKIGVFDALGAGELVLRFKGLGKHVLEPARFLK